MEKLQAILQDRVFLQNWMNKIADIPASSMSITDMVILAAWVDMKTKGFVDVESIIYHIS